MHVSTLSKAESRLWEGLQKNKKPTSLLLTQSFPVGNTQWHLRTTQGSVKKTLSLSVPSALGTSSIIELLPLYTYCMFDHFSLKLKCKLHEATDHIFLNHYTPSDQQKCLLCSCCSVAKSCSTLCNPMDCSTPRFPVLHYLSEFAQTPLHWWSHQQSHPLLPPPPPAFNLS